MNKNVRCVDRVIRVLLGLGLIGATLMGSIGAWGWIGVIPLISGLTGFCLLYKLCCCKSKGCAKDCSTSSDTGKNDPAAS